ncbi:hypothetical protein VSR82_37450 [Burkholderia sp. JPY481]|uniref:hypothetical protein n=1 Tax=Paraburkholderia sp. EG304 TaxID=3237015 RepID=UPI003172ADAF
MRVFWADWLGWFGSNVLVGALAPLIILGCIWWFRRQLRRRDPVDFFAAFRDGQLGYVGLGWAAGAFAELVKAMAVAKAATWPMVIAGFLLLIAAVFNGLNAGVNAIGPEPLTGVAPISIWSREWWFVRYAAFTSSLFVAVVTLALAGWVHAMAG